MFAAKFRFQKEKKHIHLLVLLSIGVTEIEKYLERLKLQTPLINPVLKVDVFQHIGLY